MTRIKGILFALLMSALAAPLGAGTFTAATCNRSDVNAVINGPSHVAVAGDTIIIPAGTCTWASGITITVGITVTGTGTPNTTPTTFGSGTLSTTIIDNAGSSSPLFGVTGITNGQTFTLGVLDIEPNSASTALWSPISLNGTCNSSGCPSVHIHNIGLGLTTPWTQSGNSTQADWMIRTDNVFGVVDHCTVPSGFVGVFVNASLSAYLGVGGNGDNSWAQPDSFGGTNNLFVENNLVSSPQSMMDCDVAPMNGSVGGCRIVARFNHFTFLPGAWALTIVHGLDTDGRPRSGRQQEAYGNTLTCGAGCSGPAIVGMRGGTGFVFGNAMNQSGGGFYNEAVGVNVYRGVYAPPPWGACGGLGPWDTNDGTVYYSGTVTASNGSLTMTDASKSWTTNQLAPNGAPYSVYDVTQGFWSEVVSNTATTITILNPISESGWSGFNNGDSYQILRATVCADQAGRGQGNFVSGTSPSPVASLSEALDPFYEWNNTSASMNQGNIGSGTTRIIPNRDYYTDGSHGTPHPQTSPTSPFNGSSGVGFGTLANRPSTCASRVGYWATDQGSWNQSGNSFGQGVLFVCTGTNTWSSYYTPFTYPHPLTKSVLPPTSLTWQ